MTYDFPNLWFEHYRRIIVSSRMTPAERFAMLTNAFNRAEIDKGEFLRLCEITMPEQLVNAPGGDA